MGKKHLDRAKVRIFGTHIEWRKILTFAFFLLLSATFWFILVLRQTFEITVQLPVKYTNIPDSIMLNNDLPSKINVSVSDKGVALFRSLFLKKNDSIEVNIGNYIYTKNTLIKEDQFVQLLKTKFEKTSTILRYNPSRISLNYSLLESKKVPVIFDGEISTKPNFLLSSDIQVTPESIMVYSSSRILKNLNVVYTTNNKFEELDQNTSVRLRVLKQNKIRYRPSSVDILIPVAEFAQKEISIPITCLNKPQATNVIFFPSSVSVSFAIALENFNDIRLDDFRIDLDYAELEQATQGVIKLRLTKSPSYIQNIAIKPASVEFILEKSKR